MEGYKESIIYLKSLIVILEKCDTNGNQSVSLGVLKDVHINIGNLIKKIEPMLVQEVN